MEYSKKLNLIELIKTLIEAIEYIKNNLDKDYRFMIEISIDAIRTIVNEFNSFKTVDDKLIDLIKQVLSDITEINDNFGGRNLKVCENLVDNLNDMIKIIKSNIEQKIDVVFMPYNASMWNSLESVWEAARNDPRCNCYVVPIPYYKIINTDDGNEELIFTYEGEKFPEYVNIVDYKKFDLEKVKPDIIYIHNHYDDCNTATRVDSNYYSYNLKKNTKMLVYVPYGTSGTYPAYFYLEFYAIIATRNFDKVVVQSPGFEFIAMESGIPKESLLVTGSPKFDALFKALDYSNDKLKKELGLENKTIFLWTTNLMKIIYTRHEAIDQIEELFNYIDENDEYMLIYRPHPLELEYIKSKAPECYERYAKLVDSIEKRKNIVLDKNPSYYESFNLSDALITDRSSVLIEYMNTKKPILIYDVGLERKLYEENIFDIYSNYIVGEDEMDVQTFISLVKENRDEKLELRLKALENAVVNIDGTCGEKTHCNIIEDFIENYI